MEICIQNRHSFTWALYSLQSNEKNSLVESPFMLGVVTCTCNPTTLETEFWNVVGSIPVGSNSSCVTTCNPAQGEEPD